MRIAVPPEQSKALYTVEEAAALLSIGRSTLFTLFKTGRILPVKVGKRTLVTPESIERYVERLTTEARERDLSGRWG